MNMATFTRTNDNDDLNMKIANSNEMVLSKNPIKKNHKGEEIVPV